MAKFDRRAFATEARVVSALSAAKAVWWTANGYMARRIVRPTTGAHIAPAPRSDAPDLKFLRRSWLSAFAKDADDVASGLYPRTEALPSNLAASFRRSLDFLVDARRVDARRRRGEGVEARGELGAKTYPPYYRQNFHYQSGGWLTSESARRYETQVEALFSGTAGPMRRRALSLLAKFWRDQDHRGLKIVDLACGSGAFLVDLQAAFPRSAVAGLDLSGPYLAEARRRSGASVVHASAEHLPFRDGSLDAITCIYLFHELPPKIRKTVAREIMRVLKPGGVLVFADSVQVEDAPEIARLLEVFPAMFHEPFYESYQATDLPALFGAAGLKLEGRDQAFLTKALLFQKG